MELNCYTQIRLSFFLNTHSWLFHFQILMENGKIAWWKCNMKNKNQKTFVKFCRKCVSFVRCGFNFIHLTGKLKLNFSINRNESRVEITMFNTYCTHNVPYIMIVSGCAVCSVLCAQQCSGKSVVKFLIETVLNVFVCASVRVCVWMCL